jgi:hypothetical protein
MAEMMRDALGSFPSKIETLAATRQRGPANQSASDLATAKFDIGVDIPASSRNINVTPDAHATPTKRSIDAAVIRHDLVMFRHLSFNVVSANTNALLVSSQQEWRE